MSNAPLVTNPRCAHGLETWRRCEICELDILMGKSTGFTQPSSNDLSRIRSEWSAVYTEGKVIHGLADEIERLQRELGRATSALVRNGLGLDEGTAHEPGAGLKCYHCAGAGKSQVYDHMTGYDELACDTCEGTGRITTIEQYLKTVPANWHQDSSLERWFPLTAEELKRLKDERASQPPCPACEGWPKAGNNPCSICGLVTRLVEDQPPDGERKASEGGGP